MCTNRHILWTKVIDFKSQQDSAGWCKATVEHLYIGYIIIISDLNTVVALLFRDRHALFLMKCGVCH